MKENIENNLDFRRLLREIKSSWWLYVISIIVFAIPAVVYWAVGSDKYGTQAVVLVEQRQGASTSALSALAGGGLAKAFSVGGIGSGNTDNELSIMSSREVMDSAIHATGYNVRQWEVDGLKKTLLYGEEQPFMLQIPFEQLDTLRRSFRIALLQHGDKIDATVKRGGRIRQTILWEANGLTLPAVIQTPLGDLTLEKGPAYQPAEMEYYIMVSGTPAVAEKLSKEVSIALMTKMGDVVEYYYEGPNIQNNKDFLNALIDAYRTKRISQKQQSAREDVAFFQRRLEALGMEMDSADSKLQDYQTKHNLLDVEAEAEMLARTQVENRQQLAQLQGELLYYEQVLSTLKSDDKGLFGLATRENVKNDMLEEYNKAVLEKQKLETSAKSDNVVLVNLNRRIAELRQSLISAIGMLAKEAQANLNSLYKLRGEAGSRMQKMPEYGKNYVALLRDKTIKDELYLFIMQQYESAMLDLNSTTSPVSIIDAPYPDVKPNNKKKILVTFCCLLMALFIPTAVVIWNMRRRDQIRHPMDLAKLELEENAVLLDGSRRQAAAARNILSETHRPRLIYLADFAGNPEVCQDLVDSFARSGLRNSVKTADDFAGFDDDADTLVNPEFIAVALQEAGPHGYVTVRVPDVERLDELRRTVNDGKCQLLVLVREHQMKRAHLRSLLKGFQVGGVTVGIVTHRKQS